MRAASSLLSLALVASLAGCGPDAPVSSDGGIAGITDPISMPQSASMQLDRVDSVEGCKGCHPNQYAEWRGSRHGQSMTDRVFQALVAVRQAARHGDEDRFCVQCHGIAGVRSGDVRPGFTFAGLRPVSMEGVSCAICHEAGAVVRDHNAGLSFPGDGVLRGNLDGAAAGSAHATTAGPHLGTSLFCAACHDVVELKGLSLERPFEEWTASPAAPAGQTCQDCHMPRYDGRAATTGAERKGLRSHRFVGFDPPGAFDDGDPELQRRFVADRDALLQGAARLAVRPGEARAGRTLDVVVSATNLIAGHSLPTGTTFIRQTWLELIVTDDAGRTLYESGTFDANGDLRDRWSALDPYGDADLVSLASQLLDGSGKPTLFPWEAAEHHRNALRAGETRTFTYFVPLPEEAKGTLHIAARLRMRAAPPFLVRLVKLDELLPFDPPRDLAAASGTVDVK